MSDDDETAEFEDVTCKAETEKAILCVIDDAEHWIPKSCVHDDSEIYEKGHTGKLVVKQWWAEKAGLA